jgi:hypothetical protein
MLRSFLVILGSIALSSGKIYESVTDLPKNLNYDFVVVGGVEASAFQLIFNSQ